MPRSRENTRADDEREADDRLPDELEQRQTAVEAIVALRAPLWEAVVADLDTVKGKDEDGFPARGHDRDADPGCPGSVATVTKICVNAN
jgi:hypothetical protein